MTGHTLLHELTHIDSFGLAVGYLEVTHKKNDKKDCDFEYTYHGTVNWKDKSTARNAWSLETSKAKDRPETWQNAESLAAAATEMGAMWWCDLKDIDDWVRIALLALDSVYFSNMIACVLLMF
jgi:hypothetical protein